MARSGRQEKSPFGPGGPRGLWGWSRVAGRPVAAGTHRSGSGTLGGQSGPSGFVATHSGAWVILV